MAVFVCHFCTQAVPAKGPHGVRGEVSQSAAFPASDLDPGGGGVQWEVAKQRPDTHMHTHMQITPTPMHMHTTHPVVSCAGRLNLLVAPSDSPPDPALPAAAVAGMASPGTSGPKSIIKAGPQPRTVTFVSDRRHASNGRDSFC